MPDLFFTGIDGAGEKGWKLIYADKTSAVGYMNVLESGETVEQIIWEKINGFWYAFGVDGYLKSGRVYDYRLGNWYSLSVDTRYPQELTLLMRYSCKMKMEGRKL